MGLNEFNHSDEEQLDRGTYYGTPVTRRISGDLTLSEGRYEPDARVPPHSHRDPYFCLVLHGPFEETCGDRRETCVPGTLVFHPADEVHADRFGAQGGRCFNLELGANFAERLADEGTLPRTRVTVGAGRAGALAAALRVGQHRSPLEVEAGVLALVAELAPAAALPVWRGRRPTWLDRSMEQLRAQAAPSIAGLAEEAGVHPVYFTRAFRAAFRTTPGEVARRARLERAAAALIQSDAPVTSVAHTAGFADHSHFCRHFRRAFGMTPSQYRRLFDLGAS